MTDVGRGTATVRIDAWGSVAGGTAAQYELFFARRALAKLKSPRLVVEFTDLIAAAAAALGRMVP